MIGTRIEGNRGTARVGPAIVLGLLGVAAYFVTHVIWPETSMFIDEIWGALQGIVAR